MPMWRENPRHSKIQKSTSRVITFRSERVYSAKNFDGSAPNVQTPYDASSAFFSMAKKFVTREGEGAHAVPRMTRSGRREREGCDTGAGSPTTAAGCVGWPTYSAAA